MKKNEIFEHYSHILDRMIENSTFFPYYFQYPQSTDDIFGSNDGCMADNINIYFGAERGCIVDFNYDYVVKFDLVDTIRGFSACQKEIEIYEVACAEHYEHFFAQPTYIGTYRKEIVGCPHIVCDEFIPEWFTRRDFEAKFMANDEVLFEHNTKLTIQIPLYAYPFAQCYTSTQSSEEIREIAFASSSPLADNNIDIAMSFIEEYGVEEYYDFSNFLNENGINDIHFANCGRIDGALCITDYAGFLV